MRNRRAKTARRAAPRPARRARRACARPRKPIHMQRASRYDERRVRERRAREDVPVVEVPERDGERQQREQVEVAQRERPAQVGEPEQEDARRTRARRGRLLICVPPNAPSSPRAIFHATCGPVQASVTGLRDVVDVALSRSRRLASLSDVQPDCSSSSRRGRLGSTSSCRTSKVARRSTRRASRRIAVEPVRDLVVRDEERRRVLAASAAAVACPKGGAASGRREAAARRAASAEEELQRSSPERPELVADEVQPG